MNCQLIVDFDWKIIGYIVGWPGCAQDVTSFEASDFYLNPAQFFSPGESIMADKGYVSRLMLKVPLQQPQPPQHCTAHHHHLQQQQLFEL
jgi:hypothetical protein